MTATTKVFRGKDQADQLFEHLMNGNRKLVFATLTDLPKAEAFIVLAHLLDRLHELNDYQYKSFISALERRVNPF